MPACREGAGGTAAKRPAARGVVEQRGHADEDGEGADSEEQRRCAPEANRVRTS